LRLKNKGENIAISLLGIFLFPVIFQNLHVILHHHHEIAFGYDNHEERHSTADYFFVVSHHEQHCPIVDYKFQINNLPGYFIFDLVCPGFVGLVSVCNSEEPHRLIRSARSPRAPPLPV